MRKLGLEMLTLRPRAPHTGPAHRCGSCCVPSATRAWHPTSRLALFALTVCLLTRTVTQMHT